MADHLRGRDELQAGLAHLARLAGVDEETADLVAAAAMQRYDEFLLIHPGGTTSSETE